MHPARSAAASNRIESHLGEKLTVLFRTEGDPRHPFSEAVGLLQRVEAGPEGERHWLIVKRDGTHVRVRESAVVRYKVVPPGGPLRTPRSWEEAGPAGEGQAPG